MKQNKKGFTLIELLAVIVILAIIALIATPIILNMINDARKSAAKDSAYAYLDGAEKYITMNMMNSASNGTLNTEYSVAPVAGSCDVTGTSDTPTGCAAWINALNATIKGTKPESGTITVSGSTITAISLKYKGVDTTFTLADLQS